MCLAVPSRIVEIENSVGTIEFEGVKKRVSLLLLDDVKIGDWVIVHAGFAIQKIDEKEALETLRFLRQIVAELDEKLGET